MQLLFRALKNLALQVHVAKDNSIVRDVSRAFYGFSGFAKDVTTCSPAKIEIQETTYMALYPSLVCLGAW